MELIYEYEHNNGVHLKASIDSTRKAYRYILECKPANGNDYFIFKIMDSRIYLPRTVFAYMKEAIDALNITEIINKEEWNRTHILSGCSYQM